MRRIRTPGFTAASRGAVEADDYKARLFKYIPAEVVAAYVSATGIVPETSPNRVRLLWIIFALCAVAAPLYLARATAEPVGTPLWLQVMLASFAFPVWAYALGGPFEFTPGYEPFIGSLLLIFTTLLFGLLKPK